MLNLLTFNIYFEEIALKQRLNAIGKIIETIRPAIIGLQEVTHSSLEILSKQKWFKYYDCSTKIAKPASEAYYVALFTALPILSLEKFVFPYSGMGRELIYAKIDIGNNQNIIVGTSHLESLPNSKQERLNQLQQSFNQLSNAVSIDPNCQGAIFMGDTNLLDGELISNDSNLKDVGNYRVEIAKSNRSICYQCKKSITKDHVRISKRIQIRSNIMGDQWYHPSCFWKMDFPITKYSNKMKLSWIECLPGFTALNFISMNQFLQDAGIEKKNEKQVPNLKLATIGLPNGWIDSWLSIEGNTNENGLTFDGQINGLISNKKYQSRFDRIFLYSKTSNIEILDMDRVGLQPITKGIWPSDHFGLYCTLNISIEDSMEPKTKKQKKEKVIDLTDH